MDGNPVDLGAARRARTVRVARTALPLVVAQVDDSVNMIAGTHEDGVDLWMGPDLADEIAAELQRCAADARKRAAQK